MTVQITVENNKKKIMTGRKKEMLGLKMRWGG